MIYALDTNSVIHHLRNEPNLRRNFKYAVNSGVEIIIPKVVDYEVKRGFTIHSAPAKERLYEGLVGESGFCDIVEMDSSSWQRAEKVYAELYKKHLTVGELDILIAAFCLENSCVLVTDNTKDFMNIDGLTIINWLERT